MQYDRPEEAIVERYTYQADEDESLGHAVIEAVAAVTGRSKIAPSGEDCQNGLDPLYEAVDPEALDQLFRSGDETSQMGTAEFTYCGCTVTVQSSGSVRVTRGGD